MHLKVWFIDVIQLFLNYFVRIMFEILNIDNFAQILFNPYQYFTDLLVVL